MYPYWLIGAFSVAATVAAGYKHLVRVEKRAVFAFVKFMAMITVYRAIFFQLFGNFKYVKDAVANISIIPWEATLTVFWEDACHGLPLLLLRQLIGTKKWALPIHLLATLAVMVEFGMGHVYQGIFAATLLSFYIPYSIRLGKKFGFGTVIVCHTLYDLITIVSIKLLTG